ncbi:hypothetical protein AB0L86_01325 [Micromonospora musae]|uniref:hypothetical protein n=1 Tax=Micromonospora musae TaxID=1894970 RepID=UPI00342486C6
MSPRYASLVPAEELASPMAYRQLRRPRESADFRREVEELVRQACREQEAGDLLADAFVSMSANLAGEGALSFTGLAPAPRFVRARTAYDSVMRAEGSRGSLHSYLNAAQSSLLVGDPHFREAFAHPLLVALIAHILGGPVKIVDLRAKDTQPLDVVARDNTLHIDNNPFMDEFKVIVTWTSGTERGPSGQGLTYLPRTNRLFRQCQVGPRGEAWSDEDSCIFPTRTRVDEALAAQARFYDDRRPRVVHLKDLPFPCHTIFAASRLVHHRYRTSTGAPRSAIMASFHRTDDGADRLGVGDLTGTDLDRSLLSGVVGPGFLAALRSEATDIVDALRLSVSRPDLVVDPDRHLLEGDGLHGWYARLSEGVSLNRLREATLAGSRDGDTPAVERLVLRVQYDLQGPLSMPLYADLSEEDRKRARIVIREMAPERIHHFVTRLRADRIRRGAPAPVRLPFDRSVEELHHGLRTLDQAMASAEPSGYVDPIWGPTDGHRVVRSLHRFVVDLARTAERTEDEDSLVTASAFGALSAALATDLLVLGAPGRDIAARLFTLYLGLVASDVPERESDAP